MSTEPRNGQLCSIDDLPLPPKVIALTTTPFDKFRISRSLRFMPDGSATGEDGRYSYLGLRDRTGRASTTAAIFRALEGLFEASKSSDERRFRIANIFEFMGYAPRIEVKYKLTPVGRNRLRKIADGEPLDEIFPSSSRVTRPVDQRWPHLFGQICGLNKLSPDVAMPPISRCC